MPARSPDTSSATLPSKAIGKPKKAAQALSQQRWRRGVIWALASSVFLGTIPILAKIAYTAGVKVMTVVAFRTVFAALLLWVTVLIFGRHYIRSSAPAIISSLIAGAINGAGSIFFYSSLTLIDASLGQLINITYLIFVTILLRIAGHTISWLTLARTALAIFSIYMLTAGGLGDPNWLGVGMMLVAAITFAVQLVLSQRILFDIPAPTMTLYAITAMALVVGIAWLFSPDKLAPVSATGWRAILTMGLATGLSRLTLFLGVKHLGSIQTALLSMLEVIVSIGLAIVFLNEHLTMVQWLGAAVLTVSILLVRFERNVPKFIDWWQFIWRWRIRKQIPPE